jgi:hypothetical protein
VSAAAGSGADVWRIREDLLMLPSRPVVTHQGAGRGMESTSLAEAGMATGWAISGTGSRP